MAISDPFRASRRDLATKAPGFALHPATKQAKDVAARN